MSEIDTRTFPEICGTLPLEERRTLFNRICLRTGVCERAVRKWEEGTIPGTMSLRRDVSGVVNKVLNTRTSPRTLFPANG